MTALTPFHHAFPVRDIEEARAFYGQTLGLPEGRSDTTWIDFDQLGLQIVAHEKPQHREAGEGTHHNAVAGHDDPMFFLDPSGNALEFKAFKDMGQLFAK